MVNYIVWLLKHIRTSFYIQSFFLINHLNQRQLHRDQEMNNKLLLRVTLKRVSQPSRAEPNRTERAGHITNHPQRVDKPLY
ncbi:hypothetical protein LguiA_027592 [Lonicera macranthoides]